MRGLQGRVPRQPVTEKRRHLEGKSQKDPAGRTCAGVPRGGQDRFQFMWDDLVRGAIGAVVLVDTLRLADSFPAVDYFEQTGIPFVVAVNCFEGVRRHRLADVREALAVPDAVPMTYCDARERLSTRDTLIELVQHALLQATA